MLRRNTPLARNLRTKQTDAERILWFRLRDRRLAGWKFKRQVSIDRFIVDFLFAERKLIVELDGGQHHQQQERDITRTQILEAMGYLVLRFWNNDIIGNTQGVLEEILRTLGSDHAPLTPTLTPRGRGSRLSLARDRSQPNAPEPSQRGRA
jgi:very-short-patch-repair endonuclease